MISGLYQKPALKPVNLTFNGNLRLLKTYNMELGQLCKADFPPQYHELFKAVKKGFNVEFIAPSGCGKSSMIKRLFIELNGSGIKTEILDCRKIYATAIAFGNQPEAENFINSTFEKIEKSGAKVIVVDDYFCLCSLAYGANLFKNFMEKNKSKFQFVTVNHVLLKPATLWGKLMQWRLPKTSEINIYRDIVTNAFESVERPHKPVQIPGLSDKYILKAANKELERAGFEFEQAALKRLYKDLKARCYFTSEIPNIRSLINLAARAVIALNKPADPDTVTYIKDSEIQRLSAKRLYQAS